MASIYLCARYGRRDELRGYRDRLTTLGHVITSSWLDPHPDDCRDDGRCAFEDPRALQVAVRDIGDVLTAGTLIAFTEQEDTPYSRGGRHAELGMAVLLHLLHLRNPALFLARQVLVVGPYENIFCVLAQQRFDTFDACEMWLKEAA